MSKLTCNDPSGLQDTQVPRKGKVWICFLFDVQKRSKQINQSISHILIDTYADHHTDDYENNIFDVLLEFHNDTSNIYERSMRHSSGKISHNFSCSVSDIHLTSRFTSDLEKPDSLEQSLHVIYWNSLCAGHRGQKRNTSENP